MIAPATAPPVSHRERWFIAAILLGIAIVLGVDLLDDGNHGAKTWHLVMEATMALTALIGASVVLRSSFSLKSQLTRQQGEFARYQAAAEAWQNEAKKYLQGLSSAIDAQLDTWQLSTAEKQVAFLLLKGLSVKEIADLRGTSEKTARVQCTAIYTKSGLSGRSELAAFFLEDLLPPSQKTN